jgi:predicted nuclease of restriction endonuclease-like (RecB) superfamily
LGEERAEYGVLQLAEEGHIITDSAEAIKDPYVLDFLKLPQSHQVTEKALEQKIIDNLQMFLLELGKDLPLWEGSIKYRFATDTFTLIWFSIIVF